MGTTRTDRDSTIILRNQEYQEYQNTVLEIERRMEDQFKQVSTQARISLFIHQGIIGLIILASVISLILGLIWVFQAPSFSVRRETGLIFCGVGLVFLLILSFRNPVKIQRQVMSGYSKIYMINGAFLRQLHQLDLLFKRKLFEEDITVENIEEYFKKISSAVETSMVQLLHTMQDDDLFL